MMRITKSAAWASGILLLLYSGCNGSSAGSHNSLDPADKARIERTTHYLSGQVVLLERDASLLEVREAVELQQRPEIKKLRITASTIVVKGKRFGTIDQIQRGDYVLIRYSVEPDGRSHADEIRLVSKPESSLLR